MKTVQIGKFITLSASIKKKKKLERSHIENLKSLEQKEVSKPENEVGNK